MKICKQKIIPCHILCMYFVRFISLPVYYAKSKFLVNIHDYIILLRSVKTGWVGGILARFGWKYIHVYYFLNYLYVFVSMNRFRGGISKPILTFWRGTLQLAFLPFFPVNTAFGNKQILNYIKLKIFLSIYLLMYRVELCIFFLPKCRNWSALYSLLCRYVI